MPQPFQSLKSLATLRAGVPARDLKVGDESVELIDARVLTPAFIRGGRIQQVTSQVVALSRDVVTRHAVRRGNVIVTARGEFLAGLVDVEPSELTSGLPLLAGPICHVVTCDERGAAASELAPEFVAWLLGTEYARAHMAAASRGAAIPLFSLEAIGSLPVPVPAMQEQRHIAKVAQAGRLLREARISLAEIESAANESDLVRLVGIEA